MKEYLDAGAIALAGAGIIITIFSPASSVFIYIGVLLSFIGAVVYGGIPSTNPVEAVIAKVPVPILILGASLAAVLWKITKPEVFFQDILWWAFGTFMIGTILAPTIQKVISNQ